MGKQDVLTRFVHREVKKVAEAISSCKGHSSPQVKTNQIKQHYLRCHTILGKFISIPDIPSQLTSAKVESSTAPEIRETEETEDLTKSDKDILRNQSNDLISLFCNI